jgi:hypothetical protein
LKGKKGEEEVVVVLLAAVVLDEKWFIFIWPLHSSTRNLFLN